MSFFSGAFLLVYPLLQFGATHLFTVINSGGFKVLQYIYIQWTTYFVHNKTDSWLNLVGNRIKG